MAHGKMKTLHGLYKRLGRDAFLNAAKHYSNHVHDTVEATLSEMESRWYDSAHTMTEAEKMIEDYNNGDTSIRRPSRLPTLTLGKPTQQSECNGGRR